MEKERMIKEKKKNNKGITFFHWNRYVSLTSTPIHCRWHRRLRHRRCITTNMCDGTWFMFITQLTICRCFWSMGIFSTWTTTATGSNRMQMNIFYMLLINLLKKEIHERENKTKHSMKIDFIWFHAFRVYTIFIT